jgi:hypothetical protein
MTPEKTHPGQVSNARFDQSKLGNCRMQIKNAYSTQKLVSFFPQAIAYEDVVNNNINKHNIISLFSAQRCHYSLHYVQYAFHH